MPVKTEAERFTLIETDRDVQQKTFAQDVEAGLADHPKRLPYRYLYDARGSELFEAICELPEYYLTRCEREILETNAEDIVGWFDDPVTLVELGSGSAVKTRILIEALLDHQDELLYAPIDISRSTLESSSQKLLRDYEQLEILGLAADYASGWQWLHEETEGPHLVLWLGSSVGNLSRAAAADFLGLLRKSMDSDDRLLLGVDLRKESTVLEAAYDDAEGVTALFSLNLLERINRELGGEFDPSGFRHRAVYLEDEGYIDIALISERKQRVRIDALDLTIDFEPGEVIDTEDAYKYSQSEIEELATKAGFSLDVQWRDGNEWFSLNLMTPR